MGQLAVHLGAGDQPVCFKARTHALEDGPKRLALRFGQTAAAAETRDDAIGIPRVQLPGIDDPLPLRQYEARRKLALTGRGSRLFDPFADSFG